MPVGRAGCGGDKYDAELSQLDIYVMFDDSGSMIPWWLPVVETFAKFLNDPASAGIGVGLQFFGSDEQCDPAFYANPRVPIAPLPGNAAQIQSVFPLIPIESTPTAPALTGAIQHARSWQSSHPGHKTVVWLVTDGLPSGCSSTLDNVAQAATDGLNGTPSIPTYVLGLGLALGDLHRIATAGGTGQALIVDPTNVAAVTDAMNQLRGASLPCDYALPNGGQVDPTKVNIEFSSDGATSTTVLNVGNAAGCDATAGGWYYDNPTTPSRAIVCPATCGNFKATTVGEVNVVLGCDTILK
jgi:hypothetical protein